MANGKQLSAQNIEIFTRWLESKKDDDLKQIVSRGVLSRVEIARECGFSKSVLDQNPRIKNMLLLKEEALSVSGILPLKSSSVLIVTEEPNQTLTKREQSRLTHLETLNATQIAEIIHLKDVINTLQQELTQYKMISNMIALTGRAPY